MTVINGAPNACMIDAPPMTEFRLEAQDDGIVHLVFDCPGRAMNVFSDPAIKDLGRFADWLKDSNVSGVVLRSGKTNALCAGADLNDLTSARNCIGKPRSEGRFDLAFDHFFRLSQAIRRMERAGKPIAAAIASLALGGGCEVTLGCHYRVLADDPRALLGLPEHSIGLLPGAGGTQRVPRLTGLEPALDMMLQGKTFAGNAALSAGLVHEIVAPGEEVAAAERWLRSSHAHATQPWDSADSALLDYSYMSAAIATRRAEELERTLGHIPSSLAICDVMELGMAQPIDAALRTEMSAFAELILRTEPQNMIQTLFLGKADYERALRKDMLSPSLVDAVQALASRCRQLAAGNTALAAAGFTGDAVPSVAPVQQRVTSGYWIDDSDDPRAREAKTAIVGLTDEADALATSLTVEERRMADYAIVIEGGFPAYLGGPFALAAFRRV